MQKIKAHKVLPVVLQTGFRIFFLGAALYAVIAMGWWMWLYFGNGIYFMSLPVHVWHGHEMIFGFSMAVIAGFLLTAVTNWTERPTLSGVPLLSLFLLWATARVLAFMPRSVPVALMATCDLVFLLFLIVAIMRPIIAAKQWRQSAVFSKLILLWISGAAFYVALLQHNVLIERNSLRFAVYMIVSLILTIGRRVMPFFIERGVGYPVTLRNHRTLDIGSIVLLVAFAVLDVFFNVPRLVALLSALLVVTHSLRLAGWYTPGIWKKPLLWVLFAGYAFLIAGFALKAFAAWRHLPDDSALHAFTAGGIGIFTLGMMARVSWGHTGRDLSQAPAALPWIFAPVIVAALVRTFFTLLDKEHYIFWIGVSQALWMLGFLLYLFFYFRVLVSTRVDAKFG